MAEILRECYQMPLTELVRQFPEVRHCEALKDIDFTDTCYIVRICPSSGIFEIGYASDSNWIIPAP